MGYFCTDPPAPPNPQQTAAAQTGTNVATAVANQQLGQVNQVTPQGTMTYSNTGTFTWTDPSTGQTYSLPKSTLTQALSRDEQTLSDLSYGTKTNLGTLARNQSGLLTNLLGSPLSMAGAPQGSTAEYLNQNPWADLGFADTGSQDRTFGDAGAITRSYGPADGYSADRARVEEAMYQRMAPQLEADRLRMAAKLRDQGNLRGGRAYERDQEQFNKQLTDARLGITAAGGQEQKLLNDMAAQRAGFENAAQQQAFQQAQGRGVFANTAQQQEFAQASLRGQFRNAAIGQQLQQRQAIQSEQDAARKQWLSEQYAQRQSPINEITALMSGSQMQQPSWAQTGATNIPTTDYAGLVNNRFNQESSNYKQQSDNFNQLIGGIFGAAAGYMRSDRREKDVGAKLGTVFAAGHDGEKPLPVYEYKYKDDPSGARRVGPMAQDVEKIDKKAVRSIGGTKYIDRTRLGSILKVA